MEYTGYATEWDQVVLRGDIARREFIAFWLKDGRVLAGMNVGVWDVTDPIKALITSRRRVDARALADPDVPLERAAETEEPDGSAHPRLTALEVTQPAQSGGARRPA